VRIIGTLCFGLALVILIVTLSLSYVGRPDFGHRKTGSAIVFCLLLAAGFTITRATARQEHLIGELQSSERRMKEFRDLLYTTLSSIGDAVIATDSKGIITFRNPTAQQISSWSAAKALGQPLATVFAITNQYTGETVENPAEVVLREGSVGTLERYHMSQDALDDIANRGAAFVAVQRYPVAVGLGHDTATNNPHLRSCAE
jgi:PAS domain-containing protein